jgi:hypothetical protein
VCRRVLWSKIDREIAERSFGHVDLFRFAATETPGSFSCSANAPISDAFVPRTKKFELVGGPWMGSPACTALAMKNTLTPQAKAVLTTPKRIAIVPTRTYAIGALLYDSVGQWLINLYGLGDKVEAFRASYSEWGALIIIGKGLTPIRFLRDYLYVPLGGKAI